jgi:hypothetical protein
LKLPGNPRWNKKTRVTLKNNSEFSPVEWFGFLGGIASGVSLIWLFGPMLVNFLVSHGFILNL